MKALVVAGLAGALFAGTSVYLLVRQDRPAEKPEAAVQPAPATPASAPSVAPPPQEASLPMSVEVTKPAPAAVPRKEPVRRRPSPSLAQNRSSVPAPPEPAPAPAATPAPAPEPVPPTPPPAPAATPPPPPEPVKAVEPPPPPPKPNSVTVAAGTLLSVRLAEALDSDRNKPGDTFTATLDQPLVVDGFVIAERGARLEGKVVEAAQAGRVRGVSNLAIELTHLKTSDGQRVPVKTETFTKAGQSSVGSDAAKVGAAAAIGAAIGAIAGGGKGAAIGAGVGGAAGTGGVLATRGKATHLPVETRISFRISEPVPITEKKR